MTKPVDFLGDRECVPQRTNEEWAQGRMMVTGMVQLLVILVPQNVIH